MITTLNKIRSHQPCRKGWERLLRHLGKTQADDEPLSLETVLDSNGLLDALWCLRAVEGRDREIRLYAIWCARQTQHLMADPRSIAALDAAERFARGKASAEELDAARVAAAEASAWAAARVAAAEASAWAAARASAWAAAEASAEASAWAAARASAWAATASTAVAREAQAAEFRRMCREIEAGRDPYQEAGR